MISLRKSVEAACAPCQSRSLLMIDSSRVTVDASPLRRVLYSQWAAMPFSAVSCISPLRIWISMVAPPGPITVVCRLWYRFDLGMAM